MIPNKTLIARLTAVFLGTAITSLGIVLLLASQLGVDTISTFLLGVMQHFSIKFSLASQMFNLIILVIIFFLDRSIIGIGSFINGIFIGIFVNLFTPLITLVPLVAGTKAAFVILGPLCFSIGIGIYLSANLGAAAVECLMLYFAEITPFSLKTVRITLDALLVLTGWLLGGAVGIGTILCVFASGPLIAKTLASIERFSLKNFEK